MAIFKKSKEKKKENAESGAVSDSATPKTAGHASGPASFLIKQSWITEKAGHMSPMRKYIFIVSNKANKSEVKKAVELSYGVKVQDINIVVRKGKSKRLGRSLGRTSDYKKAVVTLKEGQKIEALTP